MHFNARTYDIEFENSRLRLFEDHGYGVVSSATLSPIWPL